MPTCNGCVKPIDPAFDSVAHDDHGRAWHATCYAAKHSRRDDGVGVFDVLLWIFCWPWALARLIGRRRHWSTRRANVIGVLSAVLVVAAATIAIVVHDSSPGTPQADSLATSVGHEVVTNLESNLPLGTTIRSTSARCGDLATGTARCVVEIEATDGDVRQPGTVYVSVSDFHRDGSFRWLQTGAEGPAFE